jgi:linoleoyl-CoA desaturase
VPKTVLFPSFFTFFQSRNEYYAPSKTQKLTKKALVFDFSRNSPPCSKKTMIHFAKTTPDDFFTTLNSRVDTYFQSKGNNRFANREMYAKLIFFPTLWLGLYALLLSGWVDNLFILLGLYTAIGLSGILMAFNLSHDAAHHSIFRDVRWNAWLYFLSFNLQGVNAYLWRIRHIDSHHLFPNVDGCDADIDDNTLIRLSPHREHRPWHRWQHIYAPLLYPFYTLFWIFIKDFMYLRKRQLANLRALNHPRREIVLLLVMKAFYLFYMLWLPKTVLGLSWGQALIGFLVMHGVISLWFVFTLVSSHLAEETEFPQVGADDRLPYTWMAHQVATSLDFHPRSRAAGWLFGGFNAHVAHHLFPAVCHVHYADISKIIRQTADEFQYPYHETTLFRAIGSHFRYLRTLGAISPTKP